MTDQKISNLSDGGAVQDNDEFIIARSGQNYKIAGSAIGGGSSDSLNTVASSGSSQTVNYATADVWDITLTAACTITLSGFTNAKPDFLTLILRQDGSGSRTVSWPTITWIGTGLAPTLQTAPSSVDSVVLFSFDGGTTVFGVAQTSASGLRAGTSFPGSPSDGDLFYRTDRRILYEYDSTSSNWLSLDRKYVPFGPAQVLQGTSAATGSSFGFLPVFEDVYIERFLITSRGQSMSGSAFMTWNLIGVSAAGSSTTIATASTAADTSGNWVLHNVSVAAVATAASYTNFQLSMTKTGSPTTIYGIGMLVVRSVG